MTETPHPSPAAQAAGIRTVGFVGLGNVGGPAALNLLKGGLQVVGFDLKPNTDFTASGGRMTEHLSKIAGCDVIVQSLPGATALAATIDGLLDHLRPGQVIIELSSYALQAKEEQAARVASVGAVMLDCELSGLSFQIANRSAVIFKAGDAAAVEACTPVFDAIADNHFYLGAFGAATKMKLIANVMVCVHDLMAAEALNLGRAVGLDPVQMIEVLKPSAAGSTTFANKAPLMLSREFENGRGPFSHMFGYLDRATELAEQVGASAATPLLHRVRETFGIARQQQRHGQDIAAIIEVLEGLQAEGAAQ